MNKGVPKSTKAKIEKQTNKLDLPGRCVTRFKQSIEHLQEELHS